MLTKISNTQAGTIYQAHFNGVKIRLRNFKKFYMIGVTYGIDYSFFVQKKIKYV